MIMMRNVGNSKKLLMDGWMDVRMNGWMDGWMDGCTDGWMTASVLVGSRLRISLFDFFFFTLYISLFDSFFPSSFPSTTITTYLR